MSRLGTLSPQAIKAMFSTESSEILIVLLTIKSNSSIGLPTDICLADNFTQRLSALETQDEVYYGVISNSITYNFIPMEIVLPSDDDTAAPRCSITIHDVTRYIMPAMRQITGAPDVTLTLVLSSSPNTIEAQFSGFKLTNISYNANTVTAELTMPSLEVEPFPMHCFTPAYFPGLF